MLKIFLSFDFYGCGNIGDDLSLDGFLEIMKDKNFEFSCAVPRDFSFLKKRFPDINFFGRDSRQRLAEESDVWIGAGDTPVQMTSGDWFLQKLERDAVIQDTFNKKYFFSGVGAESEALSETYRYKKVLKKVQHIWTRDKETAELLKNRFDIGEGRLTVSSDLANISLGRLLGNSSAQNRKYDVGICYYDESPGKEDLLTIKSFLEYLNSKKKKSLFFANDVSEGAGMEKQIYKKMFSIGAKLLRKRIDYFTPSYKTESTASFAEHYKNIKTILSSRYHVLLAAAWAGCRVAAIERSSKISVLCRELDIPEIRKPLSLDKLIDAVEIAREVSKTKLNALRERSIAGLLELKEKLSH